MVEGKYVGCEASFRYKLIHVPHKALMSRPRMMRVADFVKHCSYSRSRHAIPLFDKFLGWVRAWQKRGSNFTDKYGLLLLKLIGQHIRDLRVIVHVRENFHIRRELGQKRAQNPRMALDESGKPMTK